jgi:hypothetical protein
MTTTGKITKVTSDPKGFRVQPAGDPAPPAILFTPVSDAQYATALACYQKGSDAEVTGTPPNCASISGL